MGSDSPAHPKRTRAFQRRSPHYAPLTRRNTVSFCQRKDSTIADTLQQGRRQHLSHPLSTVRIGPMLGKCPRFSAFAVMFAVFALGRIPPPTLLLGISAVRRSPLLRLAGVSPGVLCAHAWLAV